MTELDRYEMGEAPRGICFVINNFSGDQPRQGAKVDEEKIKHLFDELHFKVEIRQNLGGLEILMETQEIARRDHSKYGAFVFFIMSHGDEKDFIYGVDGIKVAVEDLMSQFKSTKCKSLENKPKLFFIQACRGQKSDPRMSRLSAPTDSIAEDGIETMHSPDADLANGLSAREADFLLAFATVPGYKAYRSQRVGSWFIQVCILCVCVGGRVGGRTDGQTYELTERLTSV